MPQEPNAPPTRIRVPDGVDWADLINPYALSEGQAVVSPDDRVWRKECDEDGTCYLVQRGKLGPDRWRFVPMNEVGYSEWRLDDTTGRGSLAWSQRDGLQVTDAWDGLEFTEADVEALARIMRMEARRAEPYVPVKASYPTTGEPQSSTPCTSPQDADAALKSTSFGDSEGGKA